MCCYVALRYVEFSFVCGDTYHLQALEFFEVVVHEGALERVVVDVEEAKEVQQQPAAGSDFPHASLSYPGPRHTCDATCEPPGCLQLATTTRCTNTRLT